MLVSAIPANRNQISVLGCNPFMAVNARGNDMQSEKTFVTSASYDKKTVSDSDLQNIYNAINEWKYFCHKQIEAGNIDFTA